MKTDDNNSTKSTESLSIDSTGAGNKPPSGDSTNLPTSDNPNPLGFQVSNSLLPLVGPWQVGFRLACGYLLFVFSLIFISRLIFCSLSAINLFQFTSPSPFTYDYVRLSVRGLVTLAGVFFCHRVIQVGERMVIPLTLLRDSENLKLLVETKNIKSAPVEHIKDVIELIKTVKAKNSKR
jgi:hypothetical protein